MVCRDCLGRTPFGSIIATILCALGVGLFCATLNIATRIVMVGIFEELFGFRVDWLETTQIIFIVIAVSMGCFSIILMVFGLLATGATRQNIYSGAKCIMGGRVSAVFFITLTYILNFIWMVVTSVMAIPIIIFVMLYSICAEEIEGRPEDYYETYPCFNLSRFGIYRNYTENVDKNALCEETELDMFCKHVKDAGPMFSLAFAGSLMIVIAMISFLMTITVNYHQIKVSKELTEYRNAVELQDADSTVMSNSKYADTSQYAYPRQGGYASSQY